jgi:hypothetical protein
VAKAAAIFLIDKEYQRVFALIMVNVELERQLRDWRTAGVEEAEFKLGS